MQPLKGSLSVYTAVFVSFIEGVLLLCSIPYVMHLLDKPPALVAYATSSGSKKEVGLIQPKEGCLAKDQRSASLYRPTIALAPMAERSAEEGSSKKEGERQGLLYLHRVQATVYTTPICTD